MNRETLKLNQNCEPSTLREKLLHDCQVDRDHDFSYEESLEEIYQEVLAIFAENGGNTYGLIGKDLITDDQATIDALDSLFDDGDWLWLSDQTLELDWMIDDLWRRYQGMPTHYDHAVKGA